ncbi:MAG: orotidine-5'-phosphate decarboxylase [Verrucomicrobiales bacterium]|nr:orotidine-5'-phosphate decarboxylase [Verrucomicrobiales bacterium]
MTYVQRLQQRIELTGSALCVGIDPRLDLHPSTADLAAFCEQVIEETAPFAAAFKPNIAYFEALGVPGYQLVEALIARMKTTGVPVILDAKRGDIGTTQEHYAKAYFDLWDVDAVTLSPYMGYDSVEPFLQHPGKGVYLLGVTSNPGAADLELHDLANGRKVFELVGDLTRRAPETPAGEGSIGLVLGLTNVSADVLARMPDVPLLIPGLGAQGGDLETLRGADRKSPSVINVSRGILYADTHLTFAEKARDYANRIAEIA